ncbi:hypothetical protein FGG08_004409 [Glutinoglossum americanum]|uniref:Uncharacterized protein n=1 Tax=Glutinoglossum americanum TaxID=1670608 RepID=A0A9P8I5S0_9PEZI|nr:hypothetical protein FGG08_004409 [Glutinoglossum americanum]
MAQDPKAKYVLAQRVDGDLVDAVYAEIELPHVAESVNTHRIEAVARGMPMTSCTIRWTAACQNVLKHFQTVRATCILLGRRLTIQAIQPHTELKDTWVRQYGLSYFPRRKTTSGNISVPLPDNVCAAIICIKYNSRFPRLIQKENLNPITGHYPLPATGSASELGLEPGQIMVHGSKYFIEYPAGYDGTHKTLDGAEEGADGGFAITLFCEKYNTGAGNAEGS